MATLLTGMDRRRKRTWFAPSSRRTAVQRRSTTMNARVAAAAVLLAMALAAPARAQILEDRKNDEIFKDVSETVLRYPQFTIFDDVTAVVADGVVTLKGKVTMPFKKSDIGKRVAKVSGVKQVDNLIGVLPVSQFDDELRYAVARAIYGSSAFWHYASMVNPPIHIIVERGRVTLTGVVASNVERMMARSLATSFTALSVTSDLKTDQEMKALLDRKGVG
jgi:hyperosmotically inducible protein